MAHVLLPGPCSPIRRCTQQYRVLEQQRPHLSVCSIWASGANDALLGVLKDRSKWYCLGAARIKRMPSKQQATASDRATLFPSPTKANVSPSSRPTCRRSVYRSASAWHGWLKSLSALTTGTLENVQLAAQLWNVISSGRQCNRHTH